MIVILFCRLWLESQTLRLNTALMVSMSTSWTTHATLWMSPWALILFVIYLVISHYLITGRSGRQTIVWLCHSKWCVNGDVVLLDVQSWNGVLSGQTPTGQALEDILNKYIPFLEDGRLAHKPITIVVITDGVPSSHSILYRHFSVILPVVLALSRRP